MRLEYASASVIPAGVWRWQHVDPVKEWADHQSGAIVVETDFLDRFEKLRKMYGAPLPISSGYRTPAHNLQVSDTGDNGPHTTARAADILIYGQEALELIGLALALGFTGIGVSQKGDIPKRFLHLDDLTAEWGPRPMIWSY